MTIESVSRRGPKPGDGVATPRHGRQRQPTGRPQPQPGRTVQPGVDSGQLPPAVPRTPAPQAIPKGRTGTPIPAAPNAPRVPHVPGVPGPAAPGANGVTPRPTRPERTERPEQRGGADRSLYDGGSPSANRLGPAKAMRARDVSR